MDLIRHVEKESSVTNLKSIYTCDVFFCVERTFWVRVIGVYVAIYKSINIREKKKTVKNLSRSCSNYLSDGSTDKKLSCNHIIKLHPDLG